MIEAQKAEEQMKKVIVRVQSEFSSLRTGRAHVSLLEGIRVDYHGSFLPIQQLSHVVSLDGKTLEIRPWDKESLQMIEQAIIKSDLGITPLNDGKVLRLTLPSLTSERRKELTRVIRKQAEDFRVAIRNIRRDVVEEIKKSEKEKKITKDDLHRSEQNIQKLTDHFVKTIDDLLAQKEKEIMEV